MIDSVFSHCKRQKVSNFGPLSLEICSILINHAFFFFPFSLEDVDRRMTIGDGIIWTYLKNVTRFMPLFSEPGIFAFVRMVDKLFSGAE